MHDGVEPGAEIAQGNFPFIHRQQQPFVHRHRGIFAGVVHQIQQDLFDGCAVGFHHLRVIVRRNFQREPGPFSPFAQTL
ncbi:hypothetical protein D3C83_184140 [compost metagenome]